MKKYFAIRFMMVALILILPIFAKAENVSVSPSGSAVVNPNTSTELMISSQQQLSWLMEQIQKLQVELSRLQGEVKKVGEQIEKLTKSLKLGAEGKEVEILQNFLKQDSEIYPEGKVTGYYGPLTEKAVKKFQQKNGIESIGVVGPKTMAKINGIIENKEESKITICHIPDGNTNNKQAITISKSAWEAHLAHGDTMGACISTQPTTPGACTTDAKLCSNGTYVSRTGPNCEFAACPTSQYYINIVSPNGGETWTTGSSQYIKWSSNLPVTHKIITVRLRDYAGREYDLLNGTLNDGIEHITVPTNLVAGAYLFEIKTFLENQTVFDKSDATFNIVAPTPTPISCSESWSCGDWSSCANNMQTRTCTDTNSCGTTNTRPALNQSCTLTPTITDTTPRIMYWWGKVNQHTDANGNWLTDPDGVSGADLDKLTYCKKFYQNTIGVEDYMLETTSTWRNRGNVDGPFTSIKMSTKCLQPSVSVTPTPTPTPTVCAPINVSISPATPQLQNASPGQGGVSLVTFNITANCNLALKSFAVSLLPMPNGYQNISSLRLYDNATGVQLGSTIAAAGAGLNFIGLNQPILPNQILSLKIMGDISSSAVIGSTVYGVFGGSFVTDTTGTFVGNNASGNLIAGNMITIVAPTFASTAAATPSAQNQMANVLEAMQGILNQLQELLKNR